MTMPDDAGELLDFWFGAPGSQERGKSRDVWFRKDDAFDASIARRFGALFERAMRGELAAWGAAPQSLLAFIVLIDQFGRNMFRGSARSFAGDAMALAAAKSLVANGRDAQLTALERWFVYLPYEHSESLADQDRCLELMRSLAADPALADLPVWAEKHRAIIIRFGRFPHRNAILGRESTAEEIEFLTQPGSSF